MSAPTPAPRLETFLSLEHDEAGERYGIVCYVRLDLLGGCLTAEVAPLPDGRWAARLYTHPEVFHTITHSKERDAEDVALHHSERVTPETFFAEPEAGKIDAPARH